MGPLTVRHKTGPDAEYPGNDHRSAREPSPAPAVEHEGEEGVGREFGSRGDGERHEDVEPQVVHVTHVAVEHQGYRHPAHSRHFRFVDSHAAGLATIHRYIRFMDTILYFNRLACSFLLYFHVDEAPCESSSPHIDRLSFRF
jgi:hypothetical protein